MHEAIRINWTLPDTTLIEHFKQFLKLHRPAESWQDGDDEFAYSIKKFNRKPNFDDWCRFGILPYLDLQLWALETDNHIPYRVMADAIYLPGEGGEENVRKTTAPLADMLMTETALDVLASQAALEIAEKNNHS